MPVKPGPDPTFDAVPKKTTVPGPQGFAMDGDKPTMEGLGGIKEKPKLQDLGGSKPTSGRTSFGLNEGDQSAPKPPPKKPPLPSKPAVLPAPVRRGR